MIKPVLPLIIAGAGIGGLAFAIRCAQHGLPVRVLEARSVPTADGAGIQLGPNATRLLQTLGVAEALKPQACAPDAIIVRKGSTGSVLQQLPLGQWIADRHGAPYWVMHRSDLHRALMETLRERHGIEPQFDWRAETCDETGAGITVTSDTGRAVEGAGLIAADGLWSRLRPFIAPATPAGAYSGKSAARTVLSRGDVPPEMAGESVGVWFSSQGHLVHYPVHAGRSVAVVVVTPRPDAMRGWGEDQASATMMDDVARIAPALKADWVSRTDWRMWALFDPHPFPSIHRGRSCLIGDAAHPVLPFLAQGGGLALEDAVVLADLIAANGATRDGLAEAFADYAQRRTARTAKVQATARRNGRIYQLGGPMALARDLTLKALSGAQVMAGYDWLYGWRHDT